LLLFQTSPVLILNDPAGSSTTVFAGAPAMAVLILFAVTFAGVASALQAVVAHCAHEPDGIPPTTPAFAQFSALLVAMIPVHGWAYPEIETIKPAITGKAFINSFMNLIFAFISP
jgi:hypothetical protein